GTCSACSGSSHIGQEFSPRLTERCGRAHRSGHCRADGNSDLSRELVRWWGGDRMIDGQITDNFVLRTPHSAPSTERSTANTTSLPHHLTTLPLSRVRLTREGSYWLLVSLVLLALGLYKGINLLCLLAYVMLACLVLNMLLAGRRLRRLRGQRLIEEPAFAGHPFAVE